ncbi:MAG: hypothetical protein ABIB97_01935 [Patescibacteria group bacterium]
MDLGDRGIDRVEFRLLEVSNGHSSDWMTFCDIRSLSDFLDLMEGWQEWLVPDIPDLDRFLVWVYFEDGTKRTFEVTEAYAADYTNAPEEVTYPISSEAFYFLARAVQTHSFSSLAKLSLVRCLSATTKIEVNNTWTCDDPHGWKQRRGSIEGDLLGPIIEALRPGDPVGFFMASPQVPHYWISLYDADNHLLVDFLVLDRLIHLGGQASDWFFFGAANLHTLLDEVMQGFPVTSTDLDEVIEALAQSRSY